MATTYLSRTPSSAGNLKTYTISAWIKRADISTTLTTQILCSYTSTSNYTAFYIGSGDKLTVNSSGTGSSCFIETNRLFRDALAWYHIVIAVDTTQSTDSDRVKFYVNGVRETSFASTTYFGSSVNTLINSTVSTNINRNQYGTVQGSSSMSHFHFCDGTALAPTVFGSTDSTTGEWMINTSPTFTPGTNGFTILKDGNTITDQSANSNNWSLGGGTLTKTEDCPSNVFCTLNRLYNTNANGDSVPVLTLGNTRLLGHGGANWYQIPSTLAFNKGKFYWECKWNSATNLTQNHAGVIDYDKCFGTGQFRDQTGSVFFTNEDGGEVWINGNVSTADYGTLAQNDILGVAVDMDAATPTVKFYKNGSLHASTNAASLAGKFVTPAQMVYGSGEFQLNFGNGIFGTTSVSSAGSNASGNGIFEYDVPSGYTALSTKGLNL